jgi:transposase
MIILQDSGLLKLEQKVKILEKQKTIIFDRMISLAEKEYNIPIRKKCSPEQSTTTE